jgi:hypothetical protein
MRRETLGQERASRGHIDQARERGGLLVEQAR